ncbi:MAG: hypothetical protein WD048_03140 [Chitinophagales bacterium]
MKSIISSCNRLPDYAYLIFFILLSAIVFLPSIPSGFVFDFIGWAWLYQQGTFLDALNSFEYKGIHPVLHAFSYSFFKLFGFDGFAWYLVTSVLHGLNAFVLFKFLKYLLFNFEITTPVFLAAVISVLFILHPYNVEPVVWKACLHYLLSFFTIVLSLYLISVNVVENSTKHYWIGILLFATALFTLEISFITPLLWFLTAALINTRLSSENKKSFLSLGIRMLLIPAFFFVGYLSLTYLKLGSAIGHYGADKHLNFDFYKILLNAYSYFVKHLLFARNFNFYNKPAYELLSQPFVLLVITGFLIFLLLAALYYFKKIPRNILLSLHFAVLFFVSLLPVLNLFFYHLLLSENDRYGYLASPFIIASFVLLFINIRSYLKWIPVLLYFMLSVYFFSITIDAWHKSGIITRALVNDFSFYDKEEIIFLNTPDNYMGAIILRAVNSDQSMFNLSLETMRGKKFEGKIWEVAQYSMVDSENKFAIQSDSSNHLSITFSKWGSWWMKNAHGAVSYETERYKMVLNDVVSYDLYIKGELNENTAVLYHDGNKWKELSIDSIKSNKAVKLNNYKGVY